MTEIHVDSADLLTLLRDVREAASTDSGTPMLRGVMLNTVPDEKAAGHLLVATATDRFCALQGTITSAGELPKRLFLHPDQISQLTALLRPYASGKRAGSTQTSVEYVCDGVRFRQVALAELGAVSVDFPYSGGDKFPDMPTLFARSHAETRTTEPFQVDGSRLTRLARIAARRSVPMSMHSRGPTKPVVVRLGADLHGLLMPWRTGADSPSPLNIPIHTIPVLNEPQEDAA